METRGGLGLVAIMATDRQARSAAQGRDQSLRSSGGVTPAGEQRQSLPDGGAGAPTSAPRSREWKPGDGWPLPPIEEQAAATVCGTPATYDGVICTLPRGHDGEHRYEDTSSAAQDRPIREQITELEQRFVVWERIRRFRDFLRLVTPWA